MCLSTMIFSVKKIIATKILNYLVSIHIENFLSVKRVYFSHLMNQKLEFPLYVIEFSWNFSVVGNELRVDGLKL